MMGPVEYAIFPNAIRPAFSSFVGITTRESAWQWVVHQVRTNVVNETWAHASNLGKLAHAFSKMFFAMGRKKFPIYLTREKADAWFDMWKIINETRMTRDNWTFWARTLIPFIPLRSCFALWLSKISNEFVPVTCAH